MTSQEIEIITQNMIDGFYLKNAGKPSDRELGACIAFFQSIKGSDHPMITEMYEMVQDRSILISSFNLDSNEPSFVRNEIKNH